MSNTCSHYNYYTNQCEIGFTCLTGNQALCYSYSHKEDDNEREQRFSKGLRPYEGNPR